MSYLIHYLHSFAIRLDALLLERGINILWYQNECGIYLFERRHITEICDIIGSYELARKYIDEALPKYPVHEQCKNTETAENELTLPSELDTERARIYFAKAIEAQYIEATASGLQWIFGSERGRKASLGYFILKVFCPNNTEQIPEKAVNQLFGVDRIGSAISQILNAKKPQKWRKTIDDLFE